MLNFTIDTNTARVVKMIIRLNRSYRLDLEGIDKMNIEALEGYGKDTLMLRVRHHLKLSGDKGMSVKVLSNRMKIKEKDKDQLFIRLNYLLDKSYIEIKKTDRVYNGLPVFIYKWKEEFK